MSLDLEEWVPGRSADPADMRKEVSKVFLEDSVIGHRSGGTLQTSQSSHCIQIPTRPRRK